MSKTTERPNRATIPHAHLPQQGAYPCLVRIPAFPPGRRDNVGAWYIASAMTLMTEPIRAVNYYKVTAVCADPYRPMPDLYDGQGLPLWDNGQGYALSTAHGRCYLQIDYHAPAEFTDDFPIPCPKVRTGIETRWDGVRGWWEKLLKGGWTRA